MTRLLDLVALRWDFLWRVLVGIGIVFAAYYWLQLTTTTGLPVDVRAYWVADPDNLYPDPSSPLGTDKYLYSPAFELVVGWGRHLPFEAFVAIWRGILLVALVWLAGPVAAPVMFWSPVASDINAGNIQLLLATAIVLGFRYPATWAFVFLTKLSPGVGVLWFALRRRWRDFAIALGVTAAIAAATFVVWPDRWFGWVELLSAPAPAVAPYYLSVWQRLPIAGAFLLLGAWRGWRWPVVAAATAALPAFYFPSWALLVGLIPFAREAAGKWIDRRRVAARQRLRAQGTSEVGAIVAE